MGLRGQDSQRGYAMAALLVTLAIMGILLTILMPVWRHEAQREKEAELVFRGEQYARAIALFKFKNQNIPNALPPSIDFLVENRFLRKKYKDPMTKDGEFLPLSFGSQQPGIPGGQPQPGPTQPGAGQRGLTPPNPIQPPGRSNTPLQPTGAGAVARHLWSPQQERGDVDPFVPRRDALRPVAVHVQRRAASGRFHADGKLPRRPWRRPQ